MRYYSEEKKCHWCNGPLTGKQERFCSKKCKAALYRARKSYVADVDRQAKAILKKGYARRRGGKKK